MLFPVFSEGNSILLFLVVEFAELALDCERFLAFFDLADNLSVDVETLADVDNLLCLGIVCSAFLDDSLE